MKYVVAGITAVVAFCVVTTSAQAVDVCNYRVQMAMGFKCPVRPGATVCLSVNAAIGPCENELECFGGPGFFCSARLVPKSGPQAQCDFSSTRAPGLKCFAPARLFRTPTPAFETDTPTFTPTDTPEADTPTATVPPAATATNTEEIPISTPSATATGVPTGTATATATVGEATPTDTVAPLSTPTDTVAPLSTPTNTEPLPTETATGTPTGTSSATATPTGTTAALILRF